MSCEKTNNLLSVEFHVLGHRREDRRLDEPALAPEPLAARRDLGSRLLAPLNKAHDLVELALRDLRSAVGVLVPRIADLVRLSLLDEEVDEAVVDALLNEDAGRGSARLTLQSALLQPRVV